MNVLKLFKEINSCFVSKVEIGFSSDTASCVILQLLCVRNAKAGQDLYPQKSLPSWSAATLSDFNFSQLKGGYSSPAICLVSRAQRVGVFNFRTDRVRVLGKNISGRIGYGSGTGIFSIYLNNRIFSGSANLDRVFFGYFPTSYLFYGT